MLSFPGGLLPFGVLRNSKPTFQKTDTNLHPNNQISDTIICCTLRTSPESSHVQTLELRVAILHAESDELRHGTRVGLLFLNDRTQYRRFKHLLTMTRGLARACFAFHHFDCCGRRSHQRSRDASNGLPIELFFPLLNRHTLSCTPLTLPCIRSHLNRRGEFPSSRFPIPSLRRFATL